MTGLVLMGRGEMRFSPTPETEKGQVRIFAGSDDARIAFRCRATFGLGAIPRTPILSELVPRPVDQREPATRGADLPRGVGEVVHPGSGRPVARRLVAPAGQRRFSRRDPDTPLRHADLRPFRFGGRGYLGLRSAAPAEHLRLRVGREAGVAGPLLRRGRARAVRHPRLRHGPDACSRTGSGSRAGAQMRLRMRAPLARARSR